jgi:hypothetical protein
MAVIKSGQGWLLMPVMLDTWKMDQEDHSLRPAMAKKKKKKKSS